MNSQITYDFSDNTARQSCVLRKLLFMYMLLVYIYPASVNAQILHQEKNNAYREIRTFYPSILKDDKNTMRFIRKSDSIVIDIGKSSLKQIMLIRHGTPKINKKGWFNFYEVENFIYRYDTVSVEPVPIDFVDINPSEVDLIYASTLNRAGNTADQLFSDHFEIVRDSAFIEFQREILPIPIIKMPLLVWQGLSRFF